MKIANIIDWTFKWIALIAASIAAIIVPNAHAVWGCVVIWIIANIIQKMYIIHLEKDNEDLRKENLMLYDRLTNIRKKHCVV